MKNHLKCLNKYLNMIWQQDFTKKFGDLPLKCAYTTEAYLSTATATVEKVEPHKEI